MNIENCATTIAQTAASREQITPGNNGGRQPDGQPARVENPKKNSNHALTHDVLERIDLLPQITSGEWSKSYLAEQVWRNRLGLPADYNEGDLDLVFAGAIIE